MEVKLEDEIKTSQGKYWVFTDHDCNGNYNLLPKVTYIIVGKETCPTTSKLHHQGYVEFDSNVRFNMIKKLYPRIYWAKRKGTAQQCKTYCSKEMVFVEIGDISQPEQGKRNDISEIRDMVKAGNTMRDICEIATNFQSLRVGEKLFEHMEKKRNWETKVFWFWGASGTNKTRTAFAEAGENAWVSGKNLKWWQGYDGHENVIIDDFRGDFCTFHELLRIFDRYPYTIEYKGGSRQLLAKNIWVTCPVHPSDVYVKDEEEVKQLLRRISLIKHFGIGDGMEVGGNISPDPK